MALANEPSLMDATAQAELIRGKQTSPLELVEAVIERIERVNPQIVAVVARYGDEAILFRLAAQLKTARPWAGRRPAVSA